MIQSHLLLFDLAFFLNNASVWDPNEGNLKPVLHADTASNYANLFKRIFIYSNGKAFTVLGKP